MYLDRRKTRDLLLEYDIAICPPHPRAAGLAMIYPWENTTLVIFAHQLYDVAVQSGYTGTEEEFISHFGSYLGNKSILYAIYDAFPETGEEDKLYFATDEKILYYWDNGYKPVKTTLIDDTILYSGDASEYYNT